MHREIDQKLKEKAAKVAKQHLTWAKRSGVLQKGQKLGVNFFIISPKPIGRKRGEHFVTDELDASDWMNIGSIQMFDECATIRATLEKNYNAAFRLETLLGLPQGAGATWRTYTGIRDKLNQTFKNARQPYRFRCLRTREDGGEVLRARFIKVTS